MATEKIFDAHFHLLFKHFISSKKSLSNDFKVGLAVQIVDEILGGAFDSQSSPKQVSESPLYLGVTSLLSVEHAFANRMLNFLGINFSKVLPLDHDLFADTKDGKRTYYDEFKRQVKFYSDSENALGKKPYNISYLRRGDDVWNSKTQAEINNILSSGDKRYLAFSIEGGHNFSNVPIRSRSVKSRNPEIQLKEIQDNNSLDFMSLNLCHLSYIPEQNLGGFAQGLNKTAQIAFKSDDFLPKTGLGLTEIGKRVIRQALTHESKPILIDVKHMSVYTRFQYYRFREKLIEENPDVDRLPVISSHTGFTFISMTDYLTKKRFSSVTRDDNEGNLICEVSAENRKIGQTNDKQNRDLYANPWSIGLFDEEITEIMESNGFIGISMDQRVLGAAKMRDGKRKKYYEYEFIAGPEWEKLFRDGQFPTGEEGIIEDILKAPTRAERHIMLFCAHLIYAVRIGYDTLPWLEGTSPWQHLCIGSDYDGLINPLNGFNNITDMKDLGKQLRRYLPIADQLLSIGNGKALKYNENGDVNTAYLEGVIADVLFKNGVGFISRYLKNWE